MAVKERSQIKGTDAQIKAFAGHNGVLAFATDTKSLHVLSGTAGTTTEFLPSTKLATVATSGSYNDLSDKPVVDSALSSTSENPVQNKVINSALDGKLSTSGGTVSGAVTFNGRITASELRRRAGQKDLIIGGADNDGCIQLYPGETGTYAAQKTASLFLASTGYTSNAIQAGSFCLSAMDATTGKKTLTGSPSGSLTWCGKPVLCGESGGFPVGFLALYAGSNVPDGWFRCDGSTVANMQTNYPKLYSVLGTNVLPNYSGRYPLGATADINSLVEGGLPNIEGTATDNAYVGRSSNFSSAFKSSTVRTEMTNLVNNDKNNQWSKWGGLVFKASDSNAIYGKSTTVTPPSVKCAFLIRHD